MIWQRWMKSRLVVSALPGSSTSQAISPALSCERLRVYLLGSVCPIRRANGSRGSRGNARAAKRIRGFFIGDHTPWKQPNILSFRGNASGRTDGDAPQLARGRHVQGLQIGAAKRAISSFVLCKGHELEQLAGQ